MPGRKFGGEENCADTGIVEGFLNRYCGGGGADRTLDLPRFSLALISFRAPTNMIICKCVINGETVNPNASLSWQIFHPYHFKFVLAVPVKAVPRRVLFLFPCKCRYGSHGSKVADHPTKVLLTTSVFLLTTGTSFKRTSKLSIFDFVFTAHVVERLTGILLEHD